MPKEEDWHFTLMAQLDELIGNYVLEGHITDFGGDGKFRISFTPQADNVLQASASWGRSLSTQNAAVGIYQRVAATGGYDFTFLDLREDRVSAVLRAHQLFPNQFSNAICEGLYHAFPTAQMPHFARSASVDSILSMIEKVKEFDKSGSDFKAYLTRK